MPWLRRSTQGAYAAASSGVLHSLRGSRALTIHWLLLLEPSSCDQDGSGFSGGLYQTLLPNASRAGLVSMDTIDAAVRSLQTHTHTRSHASVRQLTAYRHTTTGYSHVYDACGARPSGFTGLCAVRGHPLLCGWQRRASPSGTPGGCTERRPALQHQRHASSRSCIHLQVCGTRLWR